MLKTATNFSPSNEVLEVSETWEGKRKCYIGDYSYDLAVLGNDSCIILTRYNTSKSGETDQGYYPNINDSDSGKYLRAQVNGDRQTISHKYYDIDQRYTVQDVYFQGNKNFIINKFKQENQNAEDVDVRSLTIDLSKIDVTAEEDYATYGNCLVKCDNKLCSGQIQKMETSTDGYAGFYISPGISGLRDAVMYDNKVIVGCAELRFSRTNFKAPITKYNSKTGYVVVKLVSQNDEYGHNPSYSELKAGDNFDIYTSYLIDEPHSVVTKEALAVNCNLANGARGEKTYKALVTIARGTTYARSVRYYICRDYTFLDSNVVKDSGVLCGSDMMTYQFYYPRTKKGYVNGELTTYDDRSRTIYAHISATTSAGEAAKDIKVTCDTCPKIEFTALQNGTCFLYRDSIFINSYFAKQGKTIEMYDYLANNNTEANYLIEIVDDKDKKIVYATETTKTISWDGIILRKVQHGLGQEHIYQVSTDSGAGEYVIRFKTTDSATDIINNLGTTVVETEGQPVVIRSDTDYQSGQLTADLLRIENGTVVDNYDMVKDFVANVVKSIHPFILSLPKGDTMIVAITGAPSRHYDNDTGLTQVTLDWVEVDKQAEVH